MTLFELHDLIEAGENNSVEFKRKFSSEEKIAKEMVAFANTKGGKILFGIDDDRSIVGVESEKGEIELIDIVARHFCNPQIEFKTEIMQMYRRDIVILDIPESKRKPHCIVHDRKLKNNSEKVYIRVNDKSILASKETVKILKKSNPDAPPLVFSVGDKEKFVLDYLSLNEKITVTRLMSLLNLSRRRASRILITLVRARLILIHHDGKEDYYTLM